MDSLNRLGFILVTATSETSTDLSEAMPVTTTSWLLKTSSSSVKLTTQKPTPLLTPDAKYRLTDLSVKKSNSYVRNIYEENGKILTHKHGYPQFYTQILFEKGKKEIFIKTVLNDEEGISKISTCKKVEKFEKES